MMELRVVGRKTGSYNSSLGLKKRQIKKKGSVNLRKMVSYLMSDSYMYSHLLNSSSSASESEFASSPARGFHAMKGSKMKLKNSVWEYLRSESYLYSPLINVWELSPPTPAPAPGSRLQFTQVSREFLLSDMSRIPLTQEIVHKAGNDRGVSKLVNLDHDLRKETLKRRKVNGRAF